MNYGNGEPKPVGTWDFYGSCAPGNAYYGYITFTLGIFQWLPARRGVKRGKVVQRVKGYSSKPKVAYAKAIEIVEGKNATNIACTRQVTGAGKSDKESTII